MQYPIAIYKDNEGFHVTIPDLPELTARGKDMGEVISNTRRILIEYLQGLVQQNINFSRPSPIGDYVSNPEFAGCIWAVVSIELSRIMGETAEMTIRLPVQLLSHLYRTYPDKDINQIILGALKLQFDAFDPQATIASSSS